jgi:hypothetical protein
MRVVASRRARGSTVDREVEATRRARRRGRARRFISPVRREPPRSRGSRPTPRRSRPPSPQALEPALDHPLVEGHVLRSRLLVPAEVSCRRTALAGAASGSSPDVGGVLLREVETLERARITGTDRLPVNHQEVAGALRVGIERRRDVGASSARSSCPIRRPRCPRAAGSGSWREVDATTGSGAVVEASVSSPPCRMTNRGSRDDAAPREREQRARCGCSCSRLARARRVRRARRAEAVVLARGALSRTVRSSASARRRGPSRPRNLHSAADRASGTAAPHWRTGAPPREPAGIGNS